VPALRLTDHVWLVGSGEPGPAFTDTYDGHSYLIKDDDGPALLVDCGTGRGVAAWLANVDGVCDRDAVVGTLLSHYHADHAGGAAIAAATGFVVLGAPATVAALATADEEVTSLRLARDAGVYPPDYAPAPAGIEHAPEHLDVGALQLTVEPTPGHCDGHLAVRLHVGDNAALFSGDCIFSRGRVSVQAIHDCRLRDYAITVEQLATRPTEQLFPGHGPAVLADAGNDIERAAATFRSLRIPPNLLDTSPPEEPVP
jgi:glyoxylase-like metal-dependent hydrolase (beta-lactamase superfamily II)